MNKFLTLFLVISAYIAGYSQATVSNAGFENWSDKVIKDSVEEWMTSSLQFQYQGIDLNNSYQVSPGSAGNYGIHIETVLWYNQGAGQNDTVFGFIIKNDVPNGQFVGFPYSDTVDTFSGWYKSDVQPGDTAIAIVQLSKNGSVYSMNVYKFYGTQSTWTQFSFPLMNGATEEPDSVFVGFASSDPFTPGIAEPGSWLEIDDISFEFNSGSMTAPSAIPNQSFENLFQETIEVPDDWWSFDPIVYNMFGSVAVTKSTDAAAGTYSMKIENTFDYASNSIPALVTNGYFELGSGTIMGGAPFIAQPAQFSGQYKYNPSLSDTAAVMLEMWNAGSGMLVQEFDTLLSASTWSPFSINLSFTEAPDSVRITFFAGENFGSVLLIDDIQFTGGDVNVEENSPIIEWTYYPNPASEIVTVKFDEASEIEIVDISGKTIYWNNNLNSNSVDISTTEWNNGVYFIRMNNNGKVETKKLIVRH